MFVRKKPNKSGSISIQIVDKSNGAYRVVKTIGVATEPKAIETLLKKEKDERVRRVAELTLKILKNAEGTP